MEAQALERIVALAHASQIGNPGTDVPTMLVPNGYSLESLEAFQDHPTHFRGTYSTSSIEDYAAYVNHEVGAQVFVDTDDMDAEAFFDLGDADSPGHGKHRARLKLQRTAPYTACLQAHDRAFGQKELAHWIEDWHAHITGESTSGKDLTPKQLATMVRRIEVEASSERTHEEGDWNTQSSGLDALDARTGEDTPAFIRFACMPYEGLSLRTFDLRMSILTDDSKPRLKLRITGLEGIQEEIAKEFKQVLEQQIDLGATRVLLGNFRKG
ncbi:YfdQ family protein [Halomonas elongata]|uniref:YfdQ family protein n=1 Tax=Halomonas elongata (strain ATCC 33173 / DSM 2581 / NBRC 15536 / NCIMB 2198 / 1H9) TaxID=768066 RepID=E1VAY9_HALED|nr:YfdQ family protein [Halomonas elongata]WBF17851.1 YfdQ family protein [Halomonas elongata]WPU46696.1 YfdQ family protein [Halomonas elongata DSM 2581]CBV44088.1 YfdQ family protein [Halomonas elongata DSM 2581]